MDVIERARKLRKKIENLSDHMTDDEALENAELVTRWKPNIELVAEQRVFYEPNKTLYKVNEGQSHTTQSTWRPPDSPSLFSKVLIPDEEQIYPWEQPDSTNPYMMGDKVTHNGKTWESTTDNNVWEPGVYGWKEI